MEALVEVEIKGVLVMGGLMAGALVARKHVMVVKQEQAGKRAQSA